MIRTLPQQLFLSSSAYWLPLVFAVGLGLFAWFGIVRAPRGMGRARSWLLLFMLLASMLQYVMLWLPVLRYAYPSVSLVVLLSVIGCGLALADAPTPAAAGHRSLSAALIALAFAAANYRDMTVQFSVQYVAGKTENTLLDELEALMAKQPGGSFNVTDESEYEHLVFVYFNHHLPFFFGKTTAISTVRSSDEVPAGGYLVTRQGDLANFERAIEVRPHAPPRIAAIAGAVSRWARLGATVPEPLIDAGAPALVPQAWFVLRRKASGP